MTQDLTDRELDALADALDAAPEGLEPFGLVALDGYLAGTLVLPRLVPRDEWLPIALGGDAARVASAPADWRERTAALIERRRDAINASIAELGGFDPLVGDVDQQPPASEYESAAAPISRAIEPWAIGFLWALDEFDPDRRLADHGGDDAAIAMARIVRHLSPEDAIERSDREVIDRMLPLTTIDAAIEDLMDAVVTLWDANADARYAVAPRVRATPKVGRNHPCPCGSGKKFKLCHGKAA